MMKITSAEYVRSVYNLKDIPTLELPEVAFFGRSNVGKSSLINCLLSRKISKTSQTPGKTQCLNYFVINNCFYFVDAPGYGFAKVPDQVKIDWNKLITEWLILKNTNRLIIQIIDSRHAPQEKDLNLFEWLVQNKQKLILVANKTDKLKSQQINKNIDLISHIYNISIDNIVQFSSITGKGKNELWTIIQEKMVSDLNE